MAFNKAKAMQEAEKLVSQRKTLEAIKQYSLILEKDPSDLSILNTIGDLYYREKNIPEALKSFNKLADAYMKDGFTVKAIAILKKISKIDANTVEPLLKLAELYVLQGLNREAREQYAQAIEFYKKKNQLDRALETYRKVVSLDPQNRVFRTRFAEFAAQIGKKEEAARAYLEVAEGALRSGDLQEAEPALKKALELDPKSAQAQLLQARVALSKRDYARVEKLLQSVPALKASDQGRQVLLEAYLGAGKLELAEKMVVDVFRANPTDFSPLASFAALCLEKGDVDAAVAPLAETAGVLIERRETGPLMDLLRKIWQDHPQHIGSLELIYRVCEKTADEHTLPEVLGALGRAYEQAGELEKAEETYRKLVHREPANEEYQGLLKQVLEKQGKGLVPSAAALAGVEMTFAPEVEAVPADALGEVAEDAEQAAMVKEALENSDLFSRYGLVEKAVAELEKVLALYPEQIDIHRRILEVCHRSQTARAGQAAEALAKIYGKQGDLANAKRYEDLVRKLASGVPGEEVSLPTASVEAAGPVAPPAAPTVAEFDLTEATPVSAPEEITKEEPREVPLDLSAPFPAPAPAAAAAEEMDLSSDLEALTGGAAVPEAPVVERVAAPFDYEDTRVEVEFYLSQGFLDEARNTVQALEEKFPGNPQVAQLRQLVEAKAVSLPAAPAEAAPPAAEPVEAETPAWELPSEVAGLGLAEAVPEVPPEPAVPASMPMPSPPPPEPAIVAAGPPSPPEAPAAGSDLLGSLVGELEADLEGFGEPTAPPPPQPPVQARPTADAEGASSLSGLLEELGEGAAASAAQEDPETHYNLGVAFREMGLLDEAIGEFQKVVKGGQKDKFPPNFLQACSLLAVSFMDKGMPAIAAKWYKRALEFPDLGEESTLALQYDLGVAYERAGDTRTALEKFSEVYSQNIDFRDVAEKIRTLQQKAR